MTSGRHRLALAVVLAAHVALAVNASVIVPLWEPADEVAAVRQAQSLFGGAAPATGGGEAAQPIASRALHAAGLAALGARDVAFLPRPSGGGTPRDPARYLHGPDELGPTVGPARALHLLRLLAVACGACAVLATWALTRHLLPGRPGAALLAAALLGLLPPFLASCGAIGPVPLGAALLGAALAALATLAVGAQVDGRRALLTGLLLGAARLGGASLLVLLPLAPLALLLGRRDRSWRAALAPLDRVAAGLLVVAGPELAWTWTRHAITDAGAALPLASVFPRWLPLLAWGHVARTAPGVAVGAPALLVWSSLAAIASAGLALIAWRSRRGDEAVELRVAVLLLVALLLAAGDSLLAARHGRHPDGRDLLGVGAAVAALLAAGLCAWWPVRRPRLAFVAGATAVLGLAVLAAHHEAFVLGPAFRPLNRGGDPHLMCFDPLASVPDRLRLPTVRVLEPAEGAQLVTPPEIRWETSPGSAARFTVHVSAAGASWTRRSFEEDGVSFADRYAVPDGIWAALPPGVDLELRVVRLPTLDEVLSPEPLLVDQSRLLSLRRVAPSAN